MEELFSEWLGSITSTHKDDVPKQGEFWPQKSSAKVPTCSQWIYE